MSIFKKGPEDPEAEEAEALKRGLEGAPFEPHGEKRKDLEKQREAFRIEVAGSESSEILENSELKGAEETTTMMEDKEDKKEETKKRTSTSFVEFKKRISSKLSTSSKSSTINKTEEAGKGVYL